MLGGRRGMGRREAGLMVEAQGVWVVVVEVGRGDI